MTRAETGSGRWCAAPPLRSSACPAVELEEREQTTDLLGGEAGAAGHVLRRPGAAHAQGVEHSGPVEDYLLMRLTDPASQTVQSVASKIGVSEKADRSRLEKLLESGKVVKTEPVQTADGRIPATY